jgi:hypothetical protein
VTIPEDWVQVSPTELAFFFQTNQAGPSWCRELKQNLTMGISVTQCQLILVFFFDADLINLCFKVFLIRSSQVSRRMEFSIATVRALLPEAPFYLLSDGGPSRLGREG